MRICKHIWRLEESHFGYLEIPVTFGSIGTLSEYHVVIVRMVIPSDGHDQALRQLSIAILVKLKESSVKNLVMDLPEPRVRRLCCKPLCIVANPNFNLS